MKLTTAEDWLEHLDQVLWEDLSPKDCHEINQLIRQIQADALRFAAQIMTDCGNEYRLARVAIIRQADKLAANQLHPLPKAKPQ